MTIKVDSCHIIPFFNVVLLTHWSHCTEKQQKKKKRDTEEALVRLGYPPLVLSAFAFHAATFLTLSIVLGGSKIGGSQLQSQHLTVKYRSLHVDLCTRSIS